MVSASASSQQECGFEAATTINGLSRALDRSITPPARFLQILFDQLSTIALRSSSLTNCSCCDRLLDRTTIVFAAHHQLPRDPSDLLLASATAADFGALRSSNLRSQGEAFFP